MVARTVQSSAFAPTARPFITVAGDGTLAAIRETTRVAIVDLPSGSAFAELGLAADAQATEVAWVGTPPRLMVLARYSGHTTVHLVDPFGPRTISEMRLEAPMKLYASVGTHALVIGSLGTAILSASDRGITLHQFPARARPVSAGAAGTQFVVALAGAIEEWDPQNRMPKRRFKLPRPAVIHHVGGSDRVVWMITNESPTRIEVIPLVNRGQPKAHELPEPIASVSSHPRSDLLAVVGATSGRIWIVDLDGRMGLRMIGPEGIDRAEAAALVIGRTTGVLAAQTDRPIHVVPLERDSDVPVDIPTDVSASIGPVPPQHGSRPNVVPREDPPEAPQAEDTKPDRVETPPSTATAHHAPAKVGRLAAAHVPPSSASEAAPPYIKAPAVPPRDAAPAPLERASSLFAKISGAVRDLTGTSTSENPLASWRDRARNERARTAEPPPSLWDDALPAWREEAVAWARANLAVAATLDPTTGTYEAIGEAPTSTPFGAIIARYELSPQLQPVIAFLYGAHLAGHDGVAPADVARLLGGRWDEALGRGELAAQHAVETRDSLSARIAETRDSLASVAGALVRDARVRLAAPIIRALDELPPSTGQLVGTPGAVTLLGPCAIVSAGPLAIIAEACLSSIGGAILAGHAGVDPVALVAEARAYGAVPMWGVDAKVLARVPTDQPIILVVDDDATADALGIPRLQ